VVEKEGYVDLLDSLIMLTASVNLTEDGKAALLKLSRGDMRRALNVLQVSCPVRKKQPADGRHVMRPMRPSTRQQCTTVPVTLTPTTLRESFRA